MRQTFRLSSLILSRLLVADEGETLGGDGQQHGPGGILPSMRDRFRSGP